MGTNAIFGFITHDCIQWTNTIALLENLHVDGYNGGKATVWRSRSASSSLLVVKLSALR
jgi:hypothetical protein